MDLSIILVHWNTRGSLLRALECLREALPTGMSHEVIVVDNASADGSLQALARLYPEVRVIANETNVGFARANNQALALAGGEYLALLNPDAWVRPDALRILIDFLKAHPGAAMVGGRLLNQDGSLQNSFCRFPSVAGELFNKSLMRVLLPWHFATKRGPEEGPVEVSSLIGACMVLRAEAMRQVGGLDEDFFLFYEETDWCLRMRQAGWKIYHVPEAAIVHAQGNAVRQDRVAAAIEYHRSRRRYFQKHHGRLQTRLLGLGLGIKLPIDLLWAAVLWTISLGRWRAMEARMGICTRLMAWYLRRCPATEGLAHSVPRQALLPMHGGRVRVSACMITRNEEHNVRECLQALSFAEEIVVLDSFSDDATPAICREFTDRVYQAPWQGFSAMKNLCVEEASQEWVLVVDADERVTADLRTEILDCKQGVQGLSMPRKNFFLGKWMRHGGWYPDHTLRLFKKGLGRFRDRTVHESVELHGDIGRLHSPLLHYTYRDISAYLVRMERYSTLAAAQMMEERPAGSSLRLLADVVLRPSWNFLKTYVLKLGFLDGFHGLLACSLHSMYVFAKYAKLWELRRQAPVEKKTEERLPENQKNEILRP